MPKVTMPQLGESVAEGTIGKWLKNVGDHVDKYEPIVEVITDKVNAEVPSPFEGILTEILVKEGETVPNLAEIAVIEGSGAEAAAATPAAEAPKPPVPRQRPAAAAPPQPPPRRGRPAPAPARGPARRPPPPAERTVLGTGGHGPAGSDERPVPRDAARGRQQLGQRLERGRSRRRVRGPHDPGRPPPGARTRRGPVQGPGHRPLGSRHPRGRDALRGERRRRGRRHSRPPRHNRPGRRPAHRPPGSRPADSPRQPADNRHQAAPLPRHPSPRATRSSPPRRCARPSPRR